MVKIFCSKNLGKISQKTSAKKVSGRNLKKNTICNFSSHACLSILIIFSFLEFVEKYFSISIFREETQKVLEMEVSQFGAENLRMNLNWAT